MKRKVPVLNVYSMIGKNEEILWSGKPDKKCFILESIFNGLLPVALVWGIIDFGFIGVALSDDKAPLYFILPFFALHLMPVWIYLGGICFSWIKYKNTEFAVTNKGVYCSGGILAQNFEHKPFTELSHVNMHRGIIDQMLGVGDVTLTSNQDGYNFRDTRSVFRGISICDIPDYENVYHIVKDLQENIYSDTMYPNDLRPEENHGYRTKYIRKSN